MSRWYFTWTTYVGLLAWDIHTYWRWIVFSINRMALWWYFTALAMPHLILNMWLKTYKKITQKALERFMAHSLSNITEKKKDTEDAKRFNCVCGCEGKSDGDWRLRLVVVAVAVALALLNLHSKATELHCHYCITSTQISYTFSGWPCTSACWSNKCINGCEWKYTYVTNFLKLQHSTNTTATITIRFHFVPHPWTEDAVMTK